MTHRFEYHRLELAREARKVASEWLADSDDRRRTVVEVERTVPSDVRELLEWREHRATPSRAFGQAPLSEQERRNIDFTETNVFHARSCKAIGLELGVSDWIAYYDTTLTVDEHFDVFEASREDLPRHALPSYMRGGV